VEVVDDQLRVRKRLADRGGVAGARVDRHELDPGPERFGPLGEPVGDVARAASDDLPEQPPVTGQVDEPGVQRSISTPFPVSGSCSPRGLPRRVSSIPSTRGGAGSPSTPSATRRKARCVVGQLTWWASATSLTERFASPTASAIARRSRPVNRAPSGTSEIASVNVLRGHSCSRQRSRRLCQRTVNAVSPQGKSFGRVTRFCFNELDTPPQHGHAAAVSSTVTACTTRLADLVRGPTSR